MHQRYLVGLADTRSGPEQSAGAEPEQGLDELEAAARDDRIPVRTDPVAERVEPDVRALVEVREGPADDAAQDVRQERAADEQQQTDDQPAHPFGGDVQRDHEHAEVHERRPEVLLEDQDQQAHRPDRDDRAEVAPAREVDAEDPLARQRQDFALAHQVVREEGEQRELGQLTGLDGEERAEPDPQLRTVDAGEPGRQDRRDQHEHDAGEAEGVRVARQRTVVAHDVQQDHRDDDGHQGPQQLAERVAAERREVRALGRLRGAQVQPAQEHDAQPVDERDGRQQDRIGVRGEPPDHQVQAEEHDAETDQRSEELECELADQSGLDRDRVRGDQSLPEHQQPEFDVAAGTRAAPPGRRDQPGARVRGRRGREGWCGHGWSSSGGSAVNGFGSRVNCSGWASGSGCPTRWPTASVSVSAWASRLPSGWGCPTSPATAGSTA